MGCSQSRIERKEIVSRCKARKRYLKQLVKARQSLSASHALYLRSLRATGSAFVHFSSLEAPLHHPPPPPSHPPPLSPESETTTWTSSSLPPPPPPPASSTWYFWDPFMPPTLSSSEDDWDDETATTTTATPPSELGMVATKKSKDLLEMINETNEYFIKAADSGSHLSSLLEISTSTNSSSGKVKSNYECNLKPTLLWTRSFSTKWSQVGKERDMVGGGSHASTIERLYAWEKKLFQQVRNAESIKMEHEKKVEQVRKLEMNKSEDVKTDKAKKDLDKLDSRLMVSSQAIESASNEIIKLRETELYPQLIDLVKGMMSMWRSMYESHQVQTQIVQQLNTIPSSIEPTSQLHRESTLRLELEIQQWGQSFCNLVKAQRDYIQSLTGWLRLSLFQFSKNPNPETKKIYSFCEEWQLAIDRIPDKVASQGINKLLTAVHGIVAQQAGEEKQRKRSESVFKEFEKKAEALKALESKNGSLRRRTVVVERKGKVEILKGKAEQEKSKYEKAVSESREMTVNNLHKGFPQVFQAMVGFSSVCMEAFESVYNQAKSIVEEQLQQEGKEVTRLDKLAL